MVCGRHVFIESLSPGVRLAKEELDRRCPATHASEHKFFARVTDFDVWWTRQWERLLLSAFDEDVSTPVDGEE